MATWNVQGINTKYKEVFDQLDKFQIDIATLTETKKKGKGNEQYGSYVHFYSGVPKHERAKSGVSIVVHKKLKRFIKTWEEISERIMQLEIDLYGHPTVIIAAYAPINGAVDTIKDSFEEDLTMLLGKLGNKKEILMMGDFNGKVGSKIADKIVGRHGEEVSNNNGERLISICERYDLKITNGFSEHKEIHKYTWIQPTRKLKSIIDYIIQRQISKFKVQNVRVYRGAECGSDHFLLKAQVYLKHITNGSKSENTNKSKKESNQTYNINSLKEDSTKFLYKLRLSNKLEINLDQSAQNLYEELKLSIHQAAKEALGEKQKKTRDDTYWWNDTIKEQIEEKKLKYHKWLSTNKPQDRKSYAKCNHETKLQVKKAKSQAWEQKCAEVNRLIGSTRTKEAWKTIMTLRQNVCEKTKISPISISEWKQHFEELLTESRGENKDINYSTRMDANEDVTKITIKEIDRSLRGMKNGKAAGPGGIPIELIKSAPQKVKEILSIIFNKCLLNQEEIPNEWKKSIITPIFKKGNKNECKNYRGISVTSSIGRLYGRIIKNRIEGEMDNIEEQSGFRAGRSCIDNVFCIQQLLEKRKERGRETHLVFIDLCKAYDSIPIKKMFEILELKKFSTTLVNTIKSLYFNSISVVKIGEQTSAEIRVNKGLKQGCCISPTLFNIYIAEALSNWKRKCCNMGIQIGDSKLYTLLFADDQIVIAEDEDDASYMTRKLKEEFLKWGLTINMDKTKYLIVEGDGHDLDMENDNIKKCEEIKYLGVTITNKGTSEKDIYNKLNQGKKAIGMLNSILWSDQITKNTKKTIYNVIIESIATYASETWEMTEKHKKKFLTLQMDFLRRSCRVSKLEHITNEEIRNRMNIDSTIVDTIEQKRLIWYGHVKRMPLERWPRKMYEWIPPQRRKRGRPRITWSQGTKVAMEARGLREEDVEDREEWRRGTERRRQM